MECVRNIGSVKSVINITTDKVYKNQEWEWGYREDDELDGFEPYSNSKSCSELVTRCYIRSFFEHGDCAISTMRAGNVIGGGDVSVNRINPDCVRAANKKEKILVRNPGSVRPYQHVLEPIYAYAMVAIAQYVNRDFFGFYNVGPYEEDHIKTEDLVKCFAEKWHEGVLYEIGEYKGPHEANLLKLDCSRIRGRFGWSPEWRIEKAIEKTVELEKVIARGGNVRKCMESQIREYLNDKNFVY
jgi:CDP-glucose 4,6-dehydratase